MSTIRTGDRVRTASDLPGDGWSEHHRERRRPNAKGVARELYTPRTTAEKPWWIVEHENGSRGCYHAEELTRLPPVTREVATAAGEQTPLEQRVAGLERELTAFRVAMASELAGLEAEQPRVRPSELQALRGLRRVAEQWQAWRIDECGGVAFAGELVGAETRLRSALETLDEIDAGNDDPIPEIPAPPPSDAGEEVLQLRERVEELERERDGLRQRNAQALETLRHAFDLRPGCRLVNDAADDAASQLIRMLDDARQLRGRVEELVAEQEQHDALARHVRELRPALTVDEPPSVPLLELAQRRAQEGALHRELLRRVERADLDALVQGLELLDTEGGPASALAACLATLLGPAVDPPSSD